MFTKTFIRLSAGKKIAYLAIFTAVMVLVNALSIDVTTEFKLSFTATAAFYVGSIFGGVGGFAVCAIGDVIGCFISGYPPNPLILIGTGCFGLIPGIIMTYFKCNFYVKTIISFMLCLLVCTAGFNTLGIYFYYSSKSVPFFTYMLARLPVQVPVMVINCILSMFLVKCLNKTSIPFKVS